MLKPLIISGLLMLATLSGGALASWSNSVDYNTSSFQIRMKGVKNKGVNITPPSQIVAGCGSGSTGDDVYDQTTCGWLYGDPYATETGASEAAFQSGATALSDCNTSLAGNTKYYLTANITASPDDSTDCLRTSSAGTKIDLNGFTVTGRVRFTGDHNNISIFNGTVNCSHVDYCIGTATGSSAATILTSQIHHITGRNFLTTGSNYINIQFFPRRNLARIPSFKLYNLTLRYQTSTGSRNANIYIISNRHSRTEIYDNHITCDSGAAVCQGAVLYGSSGKIRNNFIDLPIHTAAGDSSRGALCDGSPMADNICDVYNNKIVSVDNRAIRYRGRIGSVYNNLIVGNTNTANCAIHIYDGNDTVDQRSYNGLDIYNNDFKDNAGCMVYGRGGKDARIYNNTASGTVGGTLARFQSLGSGSIFTTTATFCGNPSFSGSANLLADNVGSISTVVLTAYQSGPTDAASDGTVTQAGSCPLEDPIPGCGIGDDASELYDQNLCEPSGSDPYQEEFGGRQSVFQSGATTLSACSETELNGSTRYYLTQSPATAFQTFTISAISRASNVVTVDVTASTHRAVVGFPVDIAGVTDSGFNGSFTVATVVDANTFTYNQTAADTSSSSGTAKLTGNTYACFKLGAVTHLDLNGFTVTGRIVRNGSWNDTAVFNGTVECSLSNVFGVDIGDDNSCIRVTHSGGSVTTSARLHHLYVENFATGTVGAVNIGISQSPSTNSSAIPAVRVFRNRLELNTAATSSRADNVRIIGNDLTRIEVTQNYIKCGANVQACQGIEPTGDQGTEYHYNYILLEQNVTAQSARAISCDANSIPASDLGCSIHHNYIVNNNNRAIRFRSRLGSAWQNLVVNSNDTGAGAFHLGDQNNPSNEDYGVGIGLWIFDNHFKDTVGGKMFYVREATNINVYGTTRIGAQNGQLATVNAIQSGLTTNANFCNNAIFSVSGNVTTFQTGGGLAVLNAFQSGITDPASNGTVNQVGSCPF
jgi:hypothetical protein